MESLQSATESNGKVHLCTNTSSRTRPVSIGRLSPRLSSTLADLCNWSPLLRSGAPLLMQRRSHKGHLLRTVFLLIFPRERCRSRSMFSSNSRKRSARALPKGRADMAIHPSRPDPDWYDGLLRKIACSTDREEIAQPDSLLSD